LEIDKEIARRDVGETEEAIFSLRPIDKVVRVVAAVDIQSRLDGMLANDLGEIIGEFVAAVGIGKLEAVSAENKTRIGVLDGDCRESRGGSGRSK